MKEFLIEEGLSLDGMVPNNEVSMSPKECDGTSSGMYKFYCFIVEIGKVVFFLI